MPRARYNTDLEGSRLSIRGRRYDVRRRRRDIRRRRRTVRTRRREVRRDRARDVVHELDGGSGATAATRPTAGADSVDTCGDDALAQERQLVIEREWRIAEGLRVGVGL
jgi:hypothetical protein